MGDPLPAKVSDLMTWMEGKGQELKNPDISPDKAMSILQEALYRENIQRDDLLYLVRTIRNNSAWGLLILGDPCFGQEVKDFESLAKRRPV